MSICWAPGLVVEASQDGSGKIPEWRYLLPSWGAVRFMVGSLFLLCSGEARQLEDSVAGDCGGVQDSPHTGLLVTAVHSSQWLLAAGGEEQRSSAKSGPGTPLTKEGRLEPSTSLLLRNVRQELWPSLRFPFSPLTEPAFVFSVTLASKKLVKVLWAKASRALILLSVVFSLLTLQLSEEGPSPSRSPDVPT